MMRFYDKSFLPSSCTIIIGALHRHAIEYQTPNHTHTPLVRASISFVQFGLVFSKCSGASWKVSPRSASERGLLAPTSQLLLGSSPRQGQSIAPRPSTSRRGISLPLSTRCSSLRPPGNKQFEARRLLIVAVSPSEGFYVCARVIRFRSYIQSSGPHC